jgi:hypothetical protein
MIFHQRNFSMDRVFLNQLNHRAWNSEPVLHQNQLLLFFFYLFFFCRIEFGILCGYLIKTRLMEKCTLVWNLDFQNILNLWEMSKYVNGQL